MIDKQRAANGSVWWFLLVAIIPAGCSVPEAVVDARIEPLPPVAYRLLPPVAFAGGAGKPDAATVTPSGRPAMLLGRVTVESVTVGRSVQRRPIECQVLGSGPDVTMIIATIHGNESAGTPLLKMLVKRLKERPELLTGRTVVLIPVANPDGFKRRRRNNDHHVDLNRNFPAGNHKSKRRYGRSPLCEPESRAVFDAIRRFQPGRVISIHQPVGCVDYDGPAKGLAAAIAGAGDLAVKRLGTRPGSLGAYVGETLGLPIITLELPGRLRRWSPERLWNEFGAMLLAGIEWAG